MATQPPAFLALFGVIATLAAVTWGLQGGEHAAIIDCDETFNYLEPLHYLLHGSGMQTWEYAPQYGLRSWFYIALHSIPIKLVELVIPLTKPQELVVLRVFLTLASCAAEAFLCSSLSRKFGSNAAWLSAVMMGTSSGLGHARRAFLPSSTCMLCFTLGQAFWMRDNFFASLLVGSFSVLVSWPFSALPYIPIGLHALHRRGIVFVFSVAIFSLVLFGVIPAAVDSYFYGKPCWPTMEMILYNALGRSGGGAHLYGVEDWTYYPKNLFLNFNVASVVSLLAILFGDEKLRFYHGLPFFMCFIVFQSMAHKEERFLFTLFPAICWSSAAAVAPNSKTRPLWSSIRVRMLLVAFSALCVSRSLALGRLSAPSKVYKELSSEISASTGSMCIGREWHRFPSSFLLPGELDLKWTRSDFRGILPQPFQRKPHGYSIFVPNMNDMNREEPSRYSPEHECTMVADSDEPYKSDRDEVRVATPDSVLSPYSCEMIADQQATRQPFRSFAVPFNPWFGVTARKYCIYRRTSSSSSQEKS